MEWRWVEAKSFRLGSQANPMRQPCEINRTLALLSLVVVLLAAPIVSANPSQPIHNNFQSREYHQIRERDLSARAIGFQHQAGAEVDIYQHRPHLSNHQLHDLQNLTVSTSASKLKHQQGNFYVINQQVSKPTAALPNKRKYTILGNSSQSQATSKVHTATHFFNARNQPPTLATSSQILTPTQHQQDHAIAQYEQAHNQSQRAGLLEKICVGTSNKLTVTSLHNKSDHYQNLYERYKDCTYVIGNLEITWLDKSSAGQEMLDLSFLESIREITGYLLIAHVNVVRISMPNLQIIRGRDLFKSNSINEKEEFALILIGNDLESLELPNLAEIQAGSVGSYDNRNLCRIRTIEWEEILGRNYKSIFVYNGAQPECPPCDPTCMGHCWGEGPEMCQKFSKLTCAAACGGGRCFGATSSDCCHQFCAGGCTGPNQTDCLACKNFYDNGSCVQECPSMMRYNPIKFLWEPNPMGKYAFGATCVRECPENMLRDSGACVRLCPPNKRSFNGECVPCGGPCPKNCQGVEVVHSGNIDQLINCTVIEGSITILDESFTGGPMGTLELSLNPTLQPMSQQHQPSNNNNQSGALTSASASSLGGVPVLRHKPMHPSRLEVFKTLREITGHLIVRAKHPDFKDLSYFTNLKTIGGRQTTDMLQALSITRTSLVSLNLRSLRRILRGKITIEENPELCFADTIDWVQIDTIRREDVTIRNNAEASKCRLVGLQCHEQCARDGCWGAGPDECLSCNNYKLDDYCVANCSSTESLGFLSYEESSETRTCKRCHSECARGCNGTEALHCDACRSVRDGPYCVPECPSHKYNKNGVCQECDKSCGPDGCTGPSNKLGLGGCNSCAKALIKAYHNPLSPVATSTGIIGDVAVNTSDATSSPLFDIECIRAEEACPDGFYQEYVVSTSQPDGSPLKSSWGRPICRKCHDRCKRCVGMGTHKTVCECAKYVAGEQCEDRCPHDYFADENSRQCVKCSPECNGCFGPTEADCISCRVYRIYHDAVDGDSTSGPIANSLIASQRSYHLDEQMKLNPGGEQNPLGRGLGGQRAFNCTAKCPPDKPHRISESNMLDPFCSDDPGNEIDNPNSFLLRSTSILFMVIISAALMVCISIYRCQIERDKTYKMTMRLSGLEDVEPLTPSNLKPNLAPLRSIKESELSEGKELGSGFGGTVHQGFWRPESKEYKCRSIPVAIKKLRDNGQSNLNKDFLEEAYIMASVDHPNLVRLLAVCMTPKNLMLVTQLIPLGCLLDYVKKYKPLIGSKDLLEWGKQVARGMAYLEERRLVHRDLALRNVLLQTPRRALISDFGLAKFLEVDQSEYHSGGGRLPIKWLAPECFSEQKFTHKSDVWAFGVTIWELVTFGQRPFEEYEICEVPQAIIKGARLQHPDHVSTELRTVMLACWAFKPEGRPTFKQLVQSFVKFARDPDRYIVCGSKGIERRHSPITDDEGERDTKQDDYDQYDQEDEDIDECDETPTEEMSPTSISSSQPPLGSAMPNLTPSTHNRLNEMFGFELQRHRASESSDMNEASSNLATPILKKIGMFAGGRRQQHHVQTQNQHHLDHHHHHQQHQQQQQPARHNPSMKASNLIPTDPNNNTNFMPSANNSGNNNCWSMHHTVSSNSIATNRSLLQMPGHTSEQPTDMYDYLLPSPSTNEHGHAFSTFDVNSYDEVDSLQMKNPPHSAGIISNITNQEYFLTRATYVNHSRQNRNLSTSNGNVPQSLV